MRDSPTGRSGAGPSAHLIRRLPLPLKMVGLTILVGLCAWGLLDATQSRQIESIFRKDLVKRLEQQTLDARIRFDHFVKMHQEAGKLFLLQQRFQSYMARVDWSGRTASEVKTYVSPPPWYPPRSVLRTFVPVRFAVLFDQEGNPRETYSLHRHPIPQALLKPSTLLRRVSLDQSYCTWLDTGAYIITTKRISNLPSGEASLMLASPIDDEFLANSQGLVISEYPLALITGEQAGILASTAPGLLPRGTRMQSLKDEYIVSGQAFFDYGNSDLLFRMAMLIPRVELEAVLSSIRALNRKIYSVAAIVFLLSFALVMLWLIYRIRGVTDRVAAFAEDALGSRHNEGKPIGDALHRLEQRFALLTEEVVTAQQLLHDQHLVEQKAKQLDVLEVVTEDLGVGVMLLSEHGPKQMVNKAMERFADACGTRDCFTDAMEDTPRLELLDRQDRRRVFELSRLSMFGRDDVLLVQDITELEAKTAALEHFTLYDALTGLPNRTLLHDRIGQAISRAQQHDYIFSILAIDLNNLREINATLGHPIGDQLLQRVAKRLQDRLRPPDTLARLIGDEFAVLLPDSGVRKAESVVKLLLAELIRPFKLDERFCVDVSASAGIVEYPRHGEDAKSLVQHADVAMHKAKRRRLGYSVYDPETDIYTRERLELLCELRLAIEQPGGLELWYQPQMDLDTNRIFGVEALVRWLHPARGFVFPDEFIPAVEESELIDPMTRRVLTMAFEQCAVWQDAGEAMITSVNISAKSLHDPALEVFIRSGLDGLRIQPQSLCLEITESALMVDPPQAYRLVWSLHNTGVRISVDDYGSGYSSLAYLRQLPLSQIKIDKSLVQSMEHSKKDRSIVRSIIDLGHNLGHEVIAEGVEEQSMATTLKKMGCDAIQGYYLSRPLPQTELHGWLVGRSRH